MYIKRLRIYGSHIFDLRIKTWMKVILAVMYTAWAVVKMRPEKKIQACTALVSQKSWVHILYRPEFLSGLVFTAARVVYITARITFIQVCILLGKHTLICRCYKLMYMFIHYFLRELLRITNRFSQSYFISNSSLPLPSPIPDILWTKSINVIVKDNANNDFNLEQLP